MTKRTLTYISSIIIALTTLFACADNDTFSSAQDLRLTFSADTVSLDTVFSKVPTTTRTLWVHNNSRDGVRCSSIRLQNGNQTGFRINVNGVYLGESQGYQISDEEIRKGDSIRVFVEATLPVNNSLVPQLVSDDLVFLLESGVQQRVNLRAWSWDADLLDNIVISNDTTLMPQRPTVVRNGIVVKEGATLTLPAGTTLYMHNKACIDVYGRIRCLGTPGNEVVLRGDRLDNMFDYLKYDDVSGQWGGIRIHANSFGNVMEYTDIHSTDSAIVCDSSDTIYKKLSFTASTIHNAKGSGIHADNCDISISNSLISNTLGACLRIKGGITDVNNSTLAQFYPFDSSRDYALKVKEDTTKTMALDFSIRNSIVTGYSQDVVLIASVDTTKSSYLFDHCLLRTPEVSDTIRCRNIIWENPEDTTVAGWKNFRMVDTSKLRYDFHLKETSLAIDSANPMTSLPTDRDATLRDEKPDMGCYEHKKEETTE